MLMIKSDWAPAFVAGGSSDSDSDSDSVSVSDSYSDSDTQRPHQPHKSHSPGGRLKCVNGPLSQSRADGVRRTTNHKLPSIKFAKCQMNHPENCLWDTQSSSNIVLAFSSSMQTNVALGKRCFIFIFEFWMTF